MTPPSLLRSGWAQAERMTGGWFDRADSGRATQLFLLLFVAAWSAFQIVSYASLDLHPDLVEVYAWGRHPAAGYAKHPPLAGLIAAGWFAVFPAQDWAFHLLAIVNSAVALFAVDLIARRYLSGDKRLLVLLLLLLTPFYQFHGQRFSTNQVLLSSWPIATYCFLRAFEARTASWSILAGVTAALAMLGKYYSVFLIASFLIAALSHPARATYFRSASPWVSAAAGLLVLGPHLYWLATTGFQPFGYATDLHTDSTMPFVVWKDVLYLTGAVAYVAVPLLVFIAAARPNLVMLRDIVWPRAPERRMLVALLGAQILLPFVIAPLIGAVITPLWSMSAWFLLPIVLLAPETVRLSRAASIRIAMLVIVMTLVVLIAAPAIAWARYVGNDKDHRAYVKLASEEMARLWHETTPAPLRIVMGDIGLGAGASFYLPDHPDVAPGFNLRSTPWISPRDLAHDGWAGLCPGADKVCRDLAEAQIADNPSAKRFERDITARFLGHAGKTERFWFVVVPPQPQ